MVWQIKDGVYFVGVQDWDRRVFDELIPLPDGTSYNSYVVFGSQKTALIDTVDPEKTGEFLKNLEHAGVKKIDYLIVNHAEQDHSGSITQILEKYPGCKVVTNQMCAGFVKDLLHVDDEKINVIAENDEIDLGGKTLRFYLAAWVHWPETMLTLLVEDKILFTCDLFGSHFASSEGTVRDEKKITEDAKRYYAEIMMPFRAMIQGHLEKISKLDYDIIAPSHGPVYDEPKFIVDAYSQWISDDVSNKVIIPYVSMHGSTKKMVEYTVESLIDKGINVKPYNLSNTDIGDFAMELVDAATVVFATPTVLVGAHPSVVNVAFLTNALRPKTKFISFFGSFGWAGQAQKQLTDLTANLSAELIEPVFIKGNPKPDDFKKLEILCEKIKQKHNSLGLMG